jgi:PAS domain S-box-containing protein
MVGYSAEELLGMRMQDISHPGEYARNHELVQRLIEDDQPFEIEKRYVRKDGSTVWVHNSVSPVPDVHGRPKGIIAVSVDVSERKRQEQQIRLGAELLNVIIDESPSGFYIVDADFRISHMNLDSQARAFRNVNPAIGRRFDEAIRVLWPEPLATDMIRIFRHTLDTGEPYTSPGLISQRADLPGVETYEWQLRRITMPDGRHAVVCYYYDTTRLREVEQELREADRRKDEFLATLAHELRNPLAPLRAGLHLLKHLPDRVEAANVYQMMDRQLRHMVRLVDDLMEVSRITRGKVELRREPVDLVGIISSAVETSRPLIEQGKHQLEISLAGESLVLDADAVRLIQVFANLLNNAAKYTDAGGLIHVTTRRDGADAVISVQDNGAGIPDDMLGKIFDLFTQADRTAGRAQGGLGIGLTLVRSIVTLHGGSIEARSAGAGRGSQFVVRLPLAAPVGSVVEIAAVKSA